MASNAKLSKVSAADVYEGDRIAMGISPHGSTDDLPGVEYNRDALRSVAIGTVVDAPREGDDWTRDRLREGQRLMVDFAVETDDGTRYTWNVDNGYVIGPHPSLGRRSDVGKIAGLYEVEGGD